MTNIEDFEQAVKILYPFLGNSDLLSQMDPSELMEIMIAADWLRDNISINRGPSFEILRSLSMADKKALKSDPRDRLSVRLLTKMIAGDGTSDSDVEYFVNSRISVINSVAIEHLVDKTCSMESEFLNDESNRKFVQNHLVELMLEGQPLKDYSFEEFEARVTSFKVNVREALLAPGLLGNLLASEGNLNLSEMRKADKRASKGKYKPNDIAAIRHLAQVKYRPIVDAIAKFQDRMNWPVINWDPESEVDGLGRR